MIKGFRGTSLVDYPGKIASVIYTYSCNFRCPYCYNIELVLPEHYQSLPDYGIDSIISSLSERKGFIQGVVITGGEPTLWDKKLYYLIEELKINFPFYVKLDTNGSNPEILEKLLKENLVDFVAIDFKTSPSKYSLVGGNFEKVLASLSLLKTYPEKCEVRITLYPPLVDGSDLDEMFPFLEGFKFVALQKYLPEKNLSDITVTPYKYEEYEAFFKRAQDKLPNCIILKRF